MENYIIKKFIEKYGKQSFEEIENNIKEEINKSKIKIILSEDYLEYLFDIALLEYSGIETEKIPFIINKMGNKYLPTISFKQIQEIHKKSINIMKNHWNKT